MVDPGSVGTEYNITAIPTVVVLDSTGTVAKRITGLVSADELNDLVTDLTER
jgi:thiol:disulfide interchange protein